MLHVPVCRGGLCSLALMLALTTPVPAGDWPGTRLAALHGPAAVDEPLAPEGLGGRATVPEGTGVTRAQLLNIENVTADALRIRGIARASGWVVIRVGDRRAVRALADASGHWKLQLSPGLTPGAHRLRLFALEPLAVGDGAMAEPEARHRLRDVLDDEVRLWIPEGDGGRLQIGFVRDNDTRQRAVALAKAGTQAFDAFFSGSLPVPSAGFHPQQTGSAPDLAQGARGHVRLAQAGGEPRNDAAGAALQWLERSNKAYQQQVVPRLSEGGSRMNAAARPQRRPDGERRPEGGILPAGTMEEWLARARRAYGREIVPRLTGERALGGLVRERVRVVDDGRGGETPEEAERRRQEAAARAAEERRRAEAARRNAETEAQRIARENAAAAEEARLAAERERRDRERREALERQKAEELAADARRNAAAALAAAERARQRAAEQAAAEAEAKRLAAERERAEAEREARLARESEEARRLAEAERARLERERLAGLREEIERRAREARERAAAEAREERERAAREQAAREQAEREQAERERAERERAERERAEREAAARERRDAELSAERERERLARLEAERDAARRREEAALREAVQARRLAAEQERERLAEERAREERERAERARRARERDALLARRDGRGREVPVVRRPMPEVPVRRPEGNRTWQPVERPVPERRPVVARGERPRAEPVLPVRRPSGVERGIRTSARERPASGGDGGQSGPRRVLRVQRVVRKRRHRRARRYARCNWRAGRRIHPPGTYVVSRGDSLWRISRRHYRLGRRYRRIYRANRRKVRNPNLIYPCQNLYIPRTRRGWRR